MSTHSFLAPSAAHQWLSCTAAPHACRGLPDVSSPEAEEGTRWHTVGGDTLTQLIKHPGKVAFTSRDWYRLNHGLTPTEVTPELYPAEMLDYAQGYVDRAVALIKRAMIETKKPQVMVEQRFDISAYVPECQGTSDLSIVAERTLYVSDGKYGKGVQVFAKENPQLKYYALGVYESIKMFYDIDNVVLVVDQPRLDHYDEWEVPMIDLLLWGEDMKPVAQRAFNGVDVEFVPSEDNCRFCKIKGNCAARAQYNLELATEEFMAPPAQLSSAQIAEILPRLGSIQKWAKDLHAFALRQAGAGEKFPGFKVVEGRSNRYFPDKEAAAAKLTEYGYTDIWEPASLQGITKLEKMTGKKVLAQIMGDLIQKPRGKPVLVAESDPRKPISLRDYAKEDFADLDDEDESV